MEKPKCYRCKNKREVPGDYHIQCVNPDPQMTGNPTGIRRGWFCYPLIFDPVWMTKDCSNFEVKP
jgi:hypothetical protein